MTKIKVFVEGAGIPKVTLFSVPEDGTVQDVLEAVKELTDKQDLQVWIEDSDEPLNPNISLKDSGIKARSHLHIHTCHQINVTVNFNGEAKSHPFPPAKTIGTVKKWADHQFNLKDVDSTDYVLQVCNTADRPSEDTHLGSLTNPDDCSLCLDLVPKQRIEG
jgi:hypothetical protein